MTIAIETIYVTIEDAEHPIRVFGTHKKDLKIFLEEENYSQFVPSGVVTCVNTMVKLLISKKMEL